MRAPGHIGKWALSAVGIAVLLPALLLFTPPGLALAGWLVRPLSGGAVTIEGLGGTSPNRLHAATVTVSDSQGPWLRANDVSLRWSALAMLRNHVLVRDVTAARVTVLRRPVPSSTEGEPTRIDIGHLSLTRIDIAAPVIGQPAVLTAGGELHYLTRHQFTAYISASRQGNSDAYRIAGGIEQDVARGTVTVREGADGILAKLLDLPGMGPVNLSARANGARSGNTLSLSLSAGGLRANGHGTITLATRRADLDFTATAPAMTPRPDMGWQSLSADIHVHGDFDAPAIRAHLTLGDAVFTGVKARQLTADVTGDAGRADLQGTATGVTLPGEHPDIFARAPVAFEAHADLKAPARPVTFNLRHPLASLTGTAQTRGGQNLTAQLTVPSLAPFAALQGIDLRGGATARLALSQPGKQARISLNGRMNAQGASVAARLLGRNATLDFDALVEGADIVNSSIRLRGAALDTEVNGTFRKGVLNYRLALDLSDLSRLAPPVQGILSLRGSANGPLERAALSAGGDAVLATRGFARQRVAIDLKATGLPSPRDARLAMTGRLNGAPLAVHVALEGGKARRLNLVARWKSLDTKANVAIPESGGLTGRANLALARLTDIAVFTGTQITGAAHGAITFRARGAKTDAVVQASLKAARLDTIGADDITTTANIADLFGKPAFSGDIAARNISAPGAHGDARAHLSGPADRLRINLSSDLKDDAGGAVKLAATALLSLPGQRLAVSTLEGQWRGAAMTLDAPAVIDFANGGLAVDHLAAHIGGGEISASGRILPGLSLNAAARDIDLSTFKTFLPQAGAQGKLSARAALTGTIAAPQGTVTLEARDLRAAFSSRGLPPAAIDARLLLRGPDATVTATLAAGNSVHLDIQGEMPLAANRTMALHASGSTDLALLDPFVAAAGRRVRGTVTLDADVGGTLAVPRVSGSGKLTGGEIQDYALGGRVQNIEATLQADGSRIRITDLTGRAGPGTVSGSGSIDLASPGMPVDFTFNARNARPVVSDLFTANLSGDVRLTGPLDNLTVSGALQILRGEINLPENFPPEVAVLNVRRRGRPPPPPPSQSKTALDVAVRTSGPIFVRGHGVDAEMGGEIRVGGTIAAPAILGDFRMTRGSYDFAGQRLDFTSGRVGFDGIGLHGRLDPALDFVAQTVSGGVTAVLRVHGYASAPRITLSSTPQLPQDEVVAHLLFQQSVKQLTPLQLASIAQGVGAIGGIGGGFNPLSTLRRTIGLDRLAVGSTGGATASESQTTVEAGRYISRNVYVGVKQNLSGGTRTQVQIDLTRHLKAQATVSTGTDATATQGSILEDNGSSIGLSYQFEY